MLVLDGVPGATHFNGDEIRVAVEEAAKSGRRVAAHAHGIDGIRRAVQAGVHSIEHGTCLHQGPDVIKEMARRGTYLVPTISAGDVMMDADTTGVPDWIVGKLRDTQQAAIKSLRAAHRAGVPIAMGSDAATPLNFHGKNGLEVDRMRLGGLKPMECLVAATSEAAKAVGRGDQLGSIEKGKRADLLVMDSNPLDDLKRLGDMKCIRAVFLDGRLVARQPADSYPRTVLAKDCLTVGQ